GWCKEAYLAIGVGRFVEGSGRCLIFDTGPGDAGPMTARDRLPFRIIGVRQQMPVRWFTLILSLALVCSGVEAFAQSPPPSSSATSSSQSQSPALPPGMTNPAEYKNYLAAVNTQDPVKRAQALEIFLAWYPFSVLRTEAFEQTMAAWQAANNPAKAD